MLRFDSIINRLKAPILLGVVVLLIYTMTLTRWYPGDDLQWVLKVEQAVTGEPNLHPASTTSITSLVSAAQPKPTIRYLLELPTSSLFYMLGGWFGLSENAVQPVQQAHAIFGTIGVVFFFLALRKILDQKLSFLISLGLACSYAWWYYSTHLDYTIISHALSCIFLYLLVSLLVRSETQTPSYGLIYALGAISALAILYLLTGLLLIFVATIALLLQYKILDNDSGRLRFVMSRYFLSTLFVLITLGSITWILSTGGISSLQSIWRDASYAGAFAHDFNLLDIPKSLYGFSKALVTYPGYDQQGPNPFFAASSILGRVGFLAWYGLIVIIVLSPFVIVGWLYKGLGRHLSLVISMAAWFFIQIPFAAYWEPGYIKWWTGALIPWWGVIGLLLVVTTAKPILQKGISVAIVGGVIILFSVNLFSDFLPNSRPDSNLWLQISDTLGEQTNPDDLFISLGNHPLDFHLPYFARRRTLSYDLIYLTSGSNSAVADEAIRNVIRATLEQGGRIFVHDCNKGDITNRKHLFEHLSSVDSEPGVLERWNFDQKVIICEITMP